MLCVNYTNQESQITLARYILAFKPNQRAEKYGAKIVQIRHKSPVRSVYLAGECLGIDFEYVDINILKKDQLKPEFVKLNPQHTVPTLDDNGKIIWDSHAIMIYLVSKYGKNTSIYPEDPFTRAVIHQRFNFNASVAFPTFIRIVAPILFEGCKTISKNSVDETIAVYDLMETFLTGKNWAACDSVTLADFTLLPIITTLHDLVPLDEKYSNIKKWVKRGEQLPYYHANAKGLELFHLKFNQFLGRM